MTTRTLPRDEWPRLAGTDLAKALDFIRPEDAQILVVEDAGRIVGAWSVLRVTHLEGVWIDPAYRKRGSVAKRLLAATLTAARQWGAWAMTGAQTPDVAQLLTKHLRAVHVPMETYVVPVEGK
jgi:GNAT superfamily N-acetyltransferase